MHGQNDSTEDRRPTRGRKQLVLREVNDRIAELAAQFGTGSSLFVCECGDPGCASPLDLTVAEYARARRDRLAALVVPGHEQEGSGVVVERTGRYVVVSTEGEQDGRRAGA